MSRDNHLHRRGAVYYAIVPIPSDLQPIMGTKQKWVSLRTKDYAEAKRRKSAVIDQWISTFDEMRRRRDLTDDDIAVAVWDHYAAGVEAGDKERAERPTEDQINAEFDKVVAKIAQGEKDGTFSGSFVSRVNAFTDVELLASKTSAGQRLREARLKRLRLDLTTGDTRLIEPLADQFLSRNGFQIPKSSRRYRELCLKLIRADIEQLERYAERDRGDYSGKPKDPIIVEPASRPEPIGKRGETIMEIFAKYERENPNDIRADTFKQTRRDVQHFADFVGPRVTVPKIEKRHVREWKELLADYPVKATDANIFKGLDVRQIVQTNKALPKPKPTLSRQTLRRYMGSLSGFCAWLVRNDYLQFNPVEGLIPKKAPPTNPRKSFTDDAINKLFATPLFKTAKSEQWRDLVKPGNVAVRDHRYWIPLVMAYSGARPGEVAQLHVGDVRQEHGIWIMHITELGEGDKRTKTKGSMRVVPIHSKLIELGFVKRCEAQKQAGEKQIFPEIEIPETGQIAAQFSREFNRYLTKVGLKTGRDIVTYSLRHTFIDKARLSGFLDEEIGTVVGHDKATMTGRYGTEQQGTLKRRQEIVESVKYSQG